MITLPDQASTRYVNRLFDEQDVTLIGARLLALAGIITPHEQSFLISSMGKVYREMREAEGVTPSPLISTYLNHEHPGAFDVLVVEPDTRQSAHVGVIFLHGYAGNFTMPCWLFAQAARPIGAVTVCPSVGWEGNWRTRDAEVTVRNTLCYLRRRGVKRIYLAGLSNGGIGASYLVSRFSTDLVGLVLISGVSPNEGNNNLPVLVIHGRHDERIPAEFAQMYAHLANRVGTYVEFDDGHFVFVKQAEQVRNVITTWFVRQELNARHESQ
jgi:pimeloyl-ACP methyl ester carboxylesterase